MALRGFLRSCASQRFKCKLPIRHLVTRFIREDDPPTVTSGASLGLLCLPDGARVSSEALETAPPFSKALRRFRGTSEKRLESEAANLSGTKVSPDSRSSQPTTAIVRVAIIAVTLALFFGTSFNALLGHRDIAIMLALATPLGISAWGFAHAGHNEAAMALICCVLVTVVTMILVLSPLGVHDVAITGYGGVVLIGALLLSRRSFLAIVALTLVAATTAFVADLTGHTRSQISQHTGWPQYVDFLVITSVIAILGRVAVEQLFQNLGDARSASTRDSVTGLQNRRGFMVSAPMALKAAQAKGQTGVLVVADIDAFRRMNIVVGHQAADNILVETGRRVELAAGTGGHLVGRVGDDEFAVVGLGIPEAEAEAFARRIHDSMNFEFLGVSVRNSAGYARFPRDAHGIESLMLAAESSLASAKARETDRIEGPADRI